MKYLVLIIFLLIIVFDIYVWRNSKKNTSIKNKRNDRIPPTFEVRKNYIPIKDDYDIIISDFIEHGNLIQIQCSVMQNDELVRGFCTKDLRPFERKIRSEVYMIFDRLEDKQSDQTIKIWYCNLDGSEFSDTNDIPLKIIITFFKPSNMGDETKKLLKQSLYQHLKDLIEVDWNEVNAILKDCYTKEKRLSESLKRISNAYTDEISISDSTKNILRHLSMDMTFFYENIWFYGGDSSTSVYENLKAKYIKIEDCYLESLSYEYARDTVF